MTIKDLVNFGHRELIAFDSARLDAELLLAHLLGKQVTYLLAYDDEQVGFFAKWRYKRIIAQRKKGIPVAYLVNNKEFYGLDFRVNKHVLVPRPGTEALVEAVVSYIQPGDLLLDVGTGSACIPISVLKHVDDVEAIAADISSSALKVAKFNAQLHGVISRMQFFKSDLLKNIPPQNFEDRRLVVTANLPYVPTDYTVNIETTFEPQIALYGGDDGMDIYRRLLDELLVFKPKAMFFECFDFQKAILVEHAPGYRLRHLKNPSSIAGVMMLDRIK